MSTENATDAADALKRTPLLPTIRKASPTHLALYALAMICAAAAGTVLPIMTLIFGRFVTIFNGYALGSISNDEMMRQISHYTLYFVYLFLAKVCLGYIAMMLLTHLATRATSSLQKRYLASILRKPMSFHDTQMQSGSVVEALGTHTNILRSGLSDKMALSVQHGATVIAAFAIGISTVWNLALAVAAGIPATVIIIGCLSVFDDKQQRKIRSLTEQAGTIAHEVLASVKTVRSLNAEAKFTQRYQELLKQGAKIGWRRALLYGLLVATYMFILYGGYALAFWYGIRLYALGSVSEPGKVITTLFSIMIGMNSFSQLASFLGGVVNTVTSAKMLIAAIDNEQSDELQGDDEKTETVPADGDIVLSDVSFRYPARPTAQVLDGLSLTIARGKRTALVGPTGCGKSTITALLLKLYDGEGGSITIDDMPLSSIGTKALRSTIGLVQQEPRLFTGTVAENVELGLLGTDLEHLPAAEKRNIVIEACKMTQIHDFIESLPQQYDTHLGDSAKQLSGGQKQRIAIARAIVKNPSILILDEATSALDTKSEALIQSVLETAGQNRTVVAIAHRLSTIKDYDNIVALKGGKVLEQGTHDGLLGVNSGMYKNMWHIQSLYSDQEEHAVIASSDATPHARQAPSSATEKPGVRFQDEEQAIIVKTTKKGIFRTVISIISRHRPLWLAYAGLVISSIIAGGLYAAQAILYAKSVNAFQLPQSEQLQQANFWGLIWFIVCLIVAAGYYGLTCLGSGLGETVSQEYRSSYFTSFLSQPCSALDKPDSAVVKMTARLSSNPDAIRDLAGGNLSVIITVGVAVLSTTMLAIASGWKYALVVLAAGLPTIFVANWFHEKLENSFQERADAIFIDCVGFAGECVAGIRTVAALNMESYVSRRFGDMVDEHCARAKKYAIRTMLLFSLSESVDLLVMALAFWYGGWLLVHEHYDTEQFFVVFVAIVFGAQSAGSYFAHSSEIAKGAVAVREIDDACAEVARLEVSSDGLDEVDDQANDNVPLFECRRANFAYPERPECPALVDFSIKMHPGQFIAFVGESGSGKSTITQLLERFYDVDSGSVLVSGQPINSISADSLRRNFSMVSQEPVLYQGTIRDNLLLGVDTIPSQDTIAACLDACQLTDLIASLPEGDLTQVGTSGSTLSGGQKQRLAIARAVLRDSPILLLDEATSALDSETEHLIQKRLVDDFLASKRHRRGIVAIAHRLSTIRHADVIYVMREGRIIESGSHDELCALGGLYYSMWTAGDQAIANV